MALRNSMFTKLLWGFMSLYLLNISVDTTDLSPVNIPEDLSFNDQESIIELIVEKLLGFEDVIKEYDDCDSDQNTIKRGQKLDFFNNTFFVNLSIPKVALLKGNLFSNFGANITKGFPGVVLPPPKV